MLAPFGLLLGLSLCMCLTSSVAAEERDELSANHAAAATMLGDWIASSRDAVLAAGTNPVPADIRSALSGYVADEVLDRVRWSLASEGFNTLQTIFYFGHTPAITLGHVIVFSDADGVANPKLWAHELKHVMQFDSWGIDGFARRYVSDYAAVEFAANEYRWAWMKQTGRVPGVPQVSSQ